MKKLLLIGSSGLVGSRLVELLENKYQLITPDEKEFNLLDPKSLSTFLQSNQPDVVINLAAFTDVGAAEKQTGDESGLCWRLNVEGVKLLLEFLPKKSRFIQISTDMVFSGDKQDPGPYSEDHPLPVDNKKLTWYGWTKNRGEKLSTNAGHSVIRIIYPIRLKYEIKADYLRSMLNKYSQGTLHPLFSDQIITLTYIDHLASVISAIIDKNLSGIFHASSSNPTTPFEFFKHVLEKLNQDTSILEQSSLEDYLKTLDNPHRYPLFGGLKTELSAQKTGVQYYTWKEIVDQLISQGLSL